MTVIDNYFNKNASAAPLAVFRISFGLLILLSLVRFWAKGWISALYIEPRLFFSYYGFEFIHPLGHYTYWLFFICALSAFCLALGFFYRLASIVLFLSFTYIELMDKSTYLNHYYFISLVCFILIFLPAHTYFSIDAHLHKKSTFHYIPQWSIDVLKLMMSLVYFYAGIAKLNSDWLIHALPLKIWLPARNDMPIIGFLFNYEWTPYLFSWLGCLYDLSIPFLLWQKKTRLLAYFAVLSFHFITAILFPIGMFPHIMAIAALIFFSAEFHQKIIDQISKWLRLSAQSFNDVKVFKMPTYCKWVFFIFFAFQMFFPFRYLAYPGELFWTEEGYRFSWRVMLMEKAGYAQFTVIDQNGKKVVVNNNDFLTILQEKQMSTQPDMMVQYSHFLSAYFQEKGFISPKVFVDSHVTLNGRLGRPLIDDAVDLSKEKDSFKHKKWVTPFHDTIKGF